MEVIWLSQQCATSGLLWHLVLTAVLGTAYTIQHTAVVFLDRQATGEGVPDPITSFADVDLGPSLMSNVQRCKYTKPTPVQRYSIPTGIAGRDLMACAQTGSGKTGAAGHV